MVLPVTANIFNKIKTILIVSIFLFLPISACESTNFSADSGDTMKVKVVSLEKCSVTGPTITLVKEIAREMGVPINFEHAIVKTSEDAVALRHIGSPTVQINGLDIDTGAREVNQFGVT